MKSSHPKDYEIYGNDIKHILAALDYIGINPKDSSLEYVKAYPSNQSFVKVAVRVSLGNKYFVRSLYTLNVHRVHNFIQKGTLKKY